MLALPDRHFRFDAFDEKGARGEGFGSMRGCHSCDQSDISDNEIPDAVNCSHR